MIKLVSLFLLLCNLAFCQGPGFIANLNVVFPAPGGGTPALAGPIDLVSSNVWGAWSVCLRLSTNYSGEAIRIREDSGNTETDIGFVDRGDGYWILDTNAVNTHCGAANGFIVRIYVQLGTNDFLQATAAQQPKIYDGATGDVLRGSDGLPVADFDGSEDNMDTLTAPLAQPISTYYVTLADSFGSNDRFFDGITADSLTPYQRVAGVNAIYANAAGYDFATFPALDTFFLMTIVWNTSSTVAQNDEDTIASGTVGNPSPNGIRLMEKGDNASARLDGQFHTMLVFTAVHAAGIRGVIQTNLNESHVIY